MPLEVVNATDLVNNTLFLSINFGSLGNSRKVGEDVLNTEADHAYVKVSKTLLDSKELKAITKADANLRIWIKNVCHPFEKGLVLVPFGLVDRVTAKLASHRVEREILVDLFVTAYPSLREQAKQNLGPLYHEKDYPAPENVKNVFRFDYTLTTVGVPGELRTISEKLFLDEKKHREEQFKVASEEITQLMRHTLFTLVSSLQDKLEPTDEGKRKVIRQNGLNKMQQFFDIFDLKNVTNDTQLDALVRQARELMDGTTAEGLRSNDELSAKVHDGMQDITQKLIALIGEAPARMIRDEDEE